MSEWALKRFWEKTDVVQRDGGWEVTLDGRSVRTPAKAPLALPTRAMAEAVATEWEAQDKEVRPETMTVTRMANSAIDKVRIQRPEVTELLAAYGDNDLLCYRAEGPRGLVDRQSATWDPYLAWAKDTFGASLYLVEGVMPKPQDPEALARLTAPLSEATDFELAALHDLISLSGSLVLGLAAARGVAAPDEVWRASRVDELWQEEQWGPDEEATEVAEIKRRAFVDAHRFLCLCTA